MLIGETYIDFRQLCPVINQMMNTGFKFKLGYLLVHYSLITIRIHFLDKLFFKQLSNFILLGIGS